MALNEPPSTARRGYVGAVRCGDQAIRLGAAPRGRLRSSAADRRARRRPRPTATRMITPAATKTRVACASMITPGDDQRDRRRGPRAEHHQAHHATQHGGLRPLLDPGHDVDVDEPDAQAHDEHEAGHDQDVGRDADEAEADPEQRRRCPGGCAPRWRKGLTEPASTAPMRAPPPKPLIMIPKPAEPASKRLAASHGSPIEMGPVKAKLRAAARMMSVRRAGSRKV